MWVKMQLFRLIMMVLAVFLPLHSSAGELAGIRAYLAQGKTPKFMRFNVSGYNLRKTPDFNPNKRDNIDATTTAGSLYAVTRIQNLQKGVAVGLMVNGQERWAYVPHNHAQHFQFCETNACLSDVAEGLDRLLQINGISQQQLRDCLTGTDGNELAGVLLRQSLPRSTADTATLPIPRDTRGAEREAAIVTPRVEPREPEIRRAVGCIVDTRNAAKPDFQAIRGSRELRKAFIDFMTPFALEVQEATGLPAAVIVAQAAIETGWGRSSLFRRSNSLFGHSCWRQGTEQKFRIQIRGEWKELKATCSIPRPAAERGYYLKFDSAQDSVYAYASNLLHAPATQRYYRGLREAVAKSRPNPANWNEVVSGLQSYAADGQSYLSTLRSVIRSNDLSSLEGKKLCR
jgi:uncharacterized FlgJ-related protein